METITIPKTEYERLKKVFKNSSFAPIGKFVDRLRRIKTDTEIVLMRNVCEITDEITKKCFSQFKK